jgi:hypothetical protein
MSDWSAERTSDDKNERIRDLESQVAKLTQQRRRESVRYFDVMIGRLDRLLSEFLSSAKSGELDEADKQTIKHHADDLIGVGNAAIKALGGR